MTTQERINLLAEAALRSAPPETPTRPKPVTFMPSFEKLRSAEFVHPGEPAVPSTDRQIPAQAEARPFVY
jgi:hypothetical protein